MKKIKPKQRRMKEIQRGRQAEGVKGNLDQNYRLQQSRAKPSANAPGTSFALFLPFFFTSFSLFIFFLIQ
jgi:hypothetical protein